MVLTMWKHSTYQLKTVEQVGVFINLAVYFLNNIHLLKHKDSYEKAGCKNENKYVRNAGEKRKPRIFNTEKTELGLHRVSS